MATLIKGTLVQWEACGVIWYGRVKFVNKDWAYVHTVGSANPKAYFDRDHLQCIRIDGLKVR